MPLAAALRTVREQRNLSQGDVEKEFGILRNYLSRLENGHTTPSLATLEQLALAYNTSVWKIIKFAEDSEQ